MELIIYIKSTIINSCLFEQFVFVFLVFLGFVSPFSPPYREGLGVGLFESLNRVGVLDDLDGVVLHLAGGNELELRLFAEVAEVLAGIPADVHGFDVAGTEFLSRVCALAAEFYTEAAEFTKADDVASEELLAETTNHVGNDAADGTLGKRRVVVGHVLNELVVSEFGVSLCGTISLGAAGLCADVGLLCAGLRAHDANTVVDHGFLKFKG